MTRRVTTEIVRNGNRIVGCGHTRHVGTCPSCQRRAAARQASNLAIATAIGRGTEIRP